MKNLKIKIKKLSHSAVIPCYAHESDAGMDLTVTSKSYDKTNDCITYGFGIAVKIPEGYYGLIFPRSSVYKTNLILSNAVGIIDSGYTGEIKAKFYSRPLILTYKNLFYRLLSLFGYDSEKASTVAYYNDGLEYNIGDRACQLIIMPYPKVQYEEVDELPNTDRGVGGYGSTGK